MFIDYKVISTRRLFLSGGTDIEMVKKALDEDPDRFINEDSWKMEIVEDDQHLDHTEKFLPLEMADGATIEFYTCDEDEAESPEWSNAPQYRPFNEGDVIEEGDQFKFSAKDNWRDLTGPYGHPVDSSICSNPEFRKLIK